MTENTPDHLIPFREVARLEWLPRRRNGGKLSIVTLWRWSNRGVRGIKLRTVRVGETPCTTESWLREFFEALATGLPGTPKIRTPRRRQIENNAAAKFLDATGI